MPTIPTISTTTLELIVAGLTVLTVIALILAISALSTNRSLRRKAKRWQSIHSTADLDQVYERTIEAVGALRVEMGGLERKIDELSHRLRSKVDTPIMYRYNAFADVGSDLSYSVALLDAEKNGVVLTSIYTRSESHTYGKPVQNGTSTYTLTEEEIKAINQVVSNDVTRELVRS